MTTVGLSNLLATLQNGVTGINNLARQIAVTFPRMGVFTSSAPGIGGVSFTSSQATGFISVVTSSGATVYLATYPSS